jgi:phosphoribosylanthranilate isomerase
MTPAKICGLSSPEAVRASLEGGAAFIGFMLFAKSPRNVTLARAAELAAPARGRAKVVAVTVDPDDALIGEIVRKLSPDLIQLHGKESPERVRDVARQAGCGVIKVLPVAEAGDLAAAGSYAQVAEHLMFDTKPPPGASRPGGHGSAFDWSLIAGLRFSRPHFLAGGLSPGNVGQAMKVSRAPMADVSSGVEARPGLKDPALIEAFLAALR